MNKQKATGKRYKVKVRGNWEDLSELVRATHRFSRDEEALASILQEGNYNVSRLYYEYYDPAPEENFGEYLNRSARVLIGEDTRWQRLGQSIMKTFKVILYGFSVKKKPEQEEPEAKITVSLLIRKKKVTYKIYAYGELEEASIIFKNLLTSYLDENKMKYKLTSDMCTRKVR